VLLARRTCIASGAGSVVTPTDPRRTPAARKSTVLHTHQPQQRTTIEHRMTGNNKWKRNNGAIDLQLL